MQLMMYIGNDLIESIPVHFDKITQPGYLGRFKRTLKEKYADLILQSDIRAEFLVMNMNPSTTNNN